MRLPSECYQMQKTIEPHLPHLSQPQLTGLALWVDIGGHQAVDHGTPPGAAVVDHQVNLQESRWRRIPIGEGQTPPGAADHRNIAAGEGSRILRPGAAASCVGAGGSPVS